MENARAAILLIDLQNDFLTHTGFLKRPVSLSSMLDPLEILLAAARSAGHDIIWVKSHYPERSSAPAPLRPPRLDGERWVDAPMNNDRLAGGHAGRPCCVEGSKGAEFPDKILALQSSEDTILIKQRYSAFGETELAELLRERGVEQLFVGGVVTHDSVRATVADAFFLGFDVTVVADCVGASKASLNRDTLAAMAKHYARVTPHVEALTRWKSERSGLGAGDTRVLYGVLPEELSETIFDALRVELDWEQMRHRGGVVPRLICLQGSVEEDGTIPLYRHPADEQPTLKAWTPWADKLRSHCAELLGQPLNHALIQLYEDGAGYISPHADKTLDIDRGSAIIGLSLGATRSIILKSKEPGKGGEFVTQRLELPHGSLFVLGWQTNQEFQHGIRQDKRAEQEKRADEQRADGQRISLTMRTVATFLGPDGEVWGQGALRKTRGAAYDTEPAPARAQAEEMLTAFGEENRSASFDWDAAYARGFDVLDFGLLRDDHD